MLDVRCSTFISFFSDQFGRLWPKATLLTYFQKDQINTLKQIEFLQFQIPSIPQSLNPSIPQSQNPSIPQSLNPPIPKFPNP